MYVKPKNDPRNQHDDEKYDRNAWQTPEDDDTEDDDELDDDEIENRIELPGRSHSNEMWVLRARRKLAEIGAHGALMPMQHPSRQGRRAYFTA